MLNVYSIFKCPHMTEKTNGQKDESNKVTFKVHKNANKSEVKKAIREVFKVDVVSVNIQNCRGKKKRVNKHEGRSSSWKKAIVTLTKNSKKIDYFEGA